MSTSGTVTFRSNRDAIIQGALRLCGAIDPESTATITTNQTNNAAEALNQMVKAWAADGLQLWERKYGVIFPQLNQGVYVLGSPGPAGDHACLSTPLGTGFVRTTLASAAIAGATTISLTAVSTTGTVGVPSISVTSGDNIGIQQTDGTMFWTTVNGAPSGTTVTLTTGLSVGASAGAVVNDYTTKLIRPLRILDGFTRQAQGNDTPHMIIARELYNRFGMKTSSGTPIQLYYDVQENVGHVYMYPTPSDVTQLLYIEFQKPMDDFTTSTDDFDLPQEWGEALKFNLALRLAIEYACPSDKYNQIKEMAGASHMMLKGWDQEDASLFIEPDSWSYRTND